MPARKRNKKVTVNPARGFATVSTASKPKVLDESVTASPKTLPPPDGPIASQSTKFSQGVQFDTKAERPLYELTPEELESQLEQSELQIFVEEHGERSRKDAARHVLRLQTERRFVRASADRLILSSRIPQQFSQEILQSLNDEVAHNSSETAKKTRDVELGVSDDVLLVRLWTLRRALLDLGFMEHSIVTALTQLVGNPVYFEDANRTGTRETLWGLEQCLEYLALTSEEEELPGYDSHRTEKAQKLLRSAQLTKDSAFARSNSPSSPSASGIASPDTTTSGMHSEASDDANAYVSDSQPSTDTESDTGSEQHDMVETYIRLQSKLYMRRPELTIIDFKKGRAAKSKLASQIQSIDSKSAKIVKQIQTLERDILFDRDEAVYKWADVRLSLSMEDTQRKRFGVQPKEAQVDAKQELISKHAKIIDEEDDDPIAGIGEFLSNLPIENTDIVTGISKVTTTSENGAVVSSRDFGRPSGLLPRKVFEEACKARDSASQVSYSLLSTSTFSNRHSLVVRWSRSQELPKPIRLNGIQHDFHGRSFRLEMSDISCPEKSQSESYVSTAALFLIFSMSPKEKATHLRLPATWRDLWKEFSDARKEQTDGTDRAELKSIRDLISQHRSTLEQKNVIEGQSKSKNLVKASQNMTVEEEQERPPEELPAAITDSWKTRRSSPSYQQMLKSRMALPIWAFKEALLQTIELHQVIILCGETGCGKSTQVPAYILEKELSQGRSCKIYCTEPRRISAISLARRVSEELGERKNDVGTNRSLVGYAIRLESQITPKTRLIYATTGIVMRMLERGNDLNDITHLVLDEVHERTIDSDFLLIVLRKLMQRRPKLKVILMSATVNAEQFSSYLGGAPIINVPGRTFPVETRYLEDVIEVTNYGGRRDTIRQELDFEDGDMDENIEQSISTSDLSGYSLRTRNTLANFNEYRLNYELIIGLLETIATHEQYHDYSKAILVFLPGIAEIRRMNDMLAGHHIFVRDWQIHSLHSTIATEEQERAFVVPSPGVRKIVLATNIAETGITIPDVTCVVDTGKHKEMRFDERRQLSRLIESFISRANAKQRQGRAGRVQNGLCFHLFTKGRHDNLMAESQTPEMLRLSLQDLALRVKICKLGGVEQVLSEALDPPLAKNIRRAVDSLIDVKALTAGEELTPLGRQLAKLPLDVYLGKLILLSNIFDCLDAGITIAAMLSSKSPFSSPIGAKAQADLARLAFKKGDSDLITLYNAYCSWKRVCLTTSSFEYQFCRKNFLSSQTLSNIEDLKGQLVSSLVEAGFLKLDHSQKSVLNKSRTWSRQRHFVELPPPQDVNSKNDVIVGSIIAWSFYPKLLVRDGKGYKNISNNQTVSLHRTSVNKGISNPPKLLSFYHIMQSGSKFYNAHDTSAVEDFAVSLVCGEAEFKMYSGVLVIDGNRIRFSLTDWKSMLVLKGLRNNLREIIAQAVCFPGLPLSSQQAFWLQTWQRAFAQNAMNTD